MADLARAEILSVGTELLLGQIIDTHAPTMAKLLAECGIGCLRRTTIGDNFDRLVGAIEESLSRADILVTIGGLGPTQDDLTRDAIAKALGDELVLEKNVEQKLREFFAKHNVNFAESNLKQAMRPESATLIDNPNGTAPGLLCRKNGKTVIALPGPAGEFNPMSAGPVKTFLSQYGGDSVIHSRTLRIVGIGESAVEDMVKSLMDGDNPSVAPYAHLGEVHLRVTARAKTVEEADAIIDPMEKSLRSILGNAVFGIDSTTLEMAVIDLLKTKSLTLAVAESATGGGLGARLTGVPGSSEAFAGGIVAYSRAVKQNLLDVPSDLIDRHGAVSEAVALEMARNVRKKFGVDFGVSITANAGPTTDVGTAPVGQTYVAISSESGDVVDSWQYRGIREDIRRRGTQLALTTLRTQLLKLG